MYIVFLYIHNTKFDLIKSFMNRKRNEMKMEMEMEKIDEFLENINTNIDNGNNFKNYTEKETEKAMETEFENKFYNEDLENIKNYVILNTHSELPSPFIRCSKYEVEKTIIICNDDLSIIEFVSLLSQIKWEVLCMKGTHLISYTELLKLWNNNNMDNFVIKLMVLGAHFELWNLVDPLQLMKRTTHNETKHILASICGICIQIIPSYIDYLADFAKKNLSKDI